MKEPSYAIFGFNGAIGNALIRRLSGEVADYRIFAFDRSRVDVTRPDQVLPVLEYVQPRVVFNCAGISDPEACEKEQNLAFSVNTVGARVVADACVATGARLVHFSTCAVFGGERDKLLTERMRPAPLGVLGKSKLDSEGVVLGRAPSSLVIRSGWLFGPEESGVLHSWLEDADRGEKVFVRGRKTISPAYVADLADCALALSRKGARGIYHFANSGRVTIRNFARRALDKAGLEQGAVSDVDDEFFRSPWPRRAGLSCAKLERAVGAQRHWNEALDECLGAMIS
jgi:dTDP-4-dehydrorhamnose reductase